jgi:hypothetical protein
MSLRKIAAALAAWVVLWGPASANAQEAPPSLVRALTVTVKLGTEAQFEEFVAKFRAAHDKMGTSATWNAFQTVLGPENLYTFGSFFSSFKDLPTSAAPLVEAYGEAEAARVIALWAASAETSTSGVWIARPDLSVPAAVGAAAPTHYYFEAVTVRPTNVDQFEAWAKAVTEANRKLYPNEPYTAYAPSIAGGGTYIFVAPVTDLARIDGWTETYDDRIERVFGKKERDRLVALLESSLVEVASRIDVARPDLARAPAAQN